MDRSSHSGDGKIRFGVVGLTSDHCWGMGDGLAALPEVEVVGAADPNVELQEEAARHWNLPGAFAGYEEFLDEVKPDAILVCSDNAAKADIVEMAAARGVHVYQDKPMAATLDQARRSANAARKAGINVMVAYHRAFRPPYDEVGEILRNRTLGEVYLARGVVGHEGPKETDSSPFFCEWLFDAARNGGGTFVDEGCYLVDQFIDQIGPIIEVSAFTAQIGVRDYLPPDVEDNSVAILRFRSGALGILDAKWGQIGPSPVLTSFHGTAGTLSNYTDRWELYSNAGVAPPEGWDEITSATNRGADEAPPLKAWRREPGPRRGAGRSGVEQRYFVDRLLRKEPVSGATGIEVALQTQAVIEAVYESARTGRSVAVAAT